MDEQAYLRDVQYRAPDRLNARARLHARYGRGDWFPWLAAHLPLPAGGMVVDIGCGDGAFWTNAPPAVPDDLRLRLFDLSAGMVAAARAALAAAGRWRDAHADVADAASLPLADGGADIVLAAHMLYHLADPDAGLREMARVVRAGGTVAVVLNPAGQMAELRDIVTAALGDGDRAPAPLSSEEGLDLMTQHFGHVEVVRYTDRLDVTDPADLLAYLLSLPAADAPGAAEALAREVAAVFRRSSGVCSIPKASDLLLARG